MRGSERVPQREKWVPRFSAAHVSLPAVLFDLDGTLIDSNYQHVNAWAEALRDVGIVIPWKIRAGMSGKSLVRERLRVIVRHPKGIDVERLERKHDRIFRRQIRALQPCGNGDLNTVPREVVIAMRSQGLPRQA